MKKVLFCILTLLFIILGGCSGETAQQVSASNSPQWVYNDITRNIPQPDFGTVTDVANRSGNITVTYTNVEKDSVENYITILQTHGCKLGASRTESINNISYIANDKTGRHISIDYYTGGMTVSIDAAP